MLRHLSIHNFAIIDHIEIDFDKHLNIITGETGAGKSIILGALHMILGKRAELSSLRIPTEKAIIEGTFEVGHLKLEQLFESIDVEYESETIIRRELRPNGKSRTFVNDSPVKLDQLKTLTTALVDLHAQNDHSIVFGRSFFIHILDKLSDQVSVANAYKSEFDAYTSNRREWHALQQACKTQQNDLDFIQFQLNEIQQLDLREHDDEAINQELDLLENAGEIIEQLQGAEQLIDNDDQGISNLIRDVSNRLQKLASFSPALKTISERIDDVQIELDDISAVISDVAGSTQIDEDRLSELRERRNLINRLLQKHRLSDVADLMQLQAELQEKLDAIQISDERLTELETLVHEQHAKLRRTATKLSKGRLQSTQSLTDSITKILHEIGMPYAQTSLQHKPLEEGNLNVSGIDAFEFYFSANKGVEQQPLKQVASGGERSRLLLAIKAIVAKHTTLSTMIFDEIDTGISGEVATKVGKIFRQLTKDHQLIAITHLPQIAARADKHHFVFKDDSRAQTVARIKALSKDEQIVEIAKMLSGKQPGKSALSTATELIAIN